MPTFLYSSIAQPVEHAAVNRRVVGSSPTWGARGPLAQLVEQPAHNRSVLGSSPGRSSKKRERDDPVLKSCKYCGRIHDSKFDCGMKPQNKKIKTNATMFRNSRKWRDKREQIRRRDKNLCQICIRNLYGTMIQFNHENLSVHHAVPIEVDYDRRLDDDNLLTVCDVHHEMAESGTIPYEVVKQIIDEQEEAYGEYVY